MRKAICLTALLALCFTIPAFAATASDLAKFLPDKLAGYQAAFKANTMQMKMSGKETMNANRMYRKDKLQVTVTIMSGGFVVQMSKVAKMQMSMETADLSLKTIKVAGFPARRMIHKKSKMVTVQVFVANSILVTAAQMNSIDPKPVLAVLGAMDLKGLSKLK